MGNTWIRGCFNATVSWYTAVMMQAENSPSRRNNRLLILVDCHRRLLAPLLPDSIRAEWLAKWEPAGRQSQGYALNALILPASAFRTEGEANSLWETVAQNLMQHSIGPANVWPIVDSVFAELALNAAQHSASPEGCCATVECLTSEDEILYVIGVMDYGIGIPSSLRNNPAYQHINDKYDAISRSLELEVTGTLEHRGSGLPHVTKSVKESAGDLAIISRGGHLVIQKGDDPIQGDFTGQDWALHPGTLVLAAIPIPQMRQ